MSTEYELVEPDPAALIESLRSFGYSVESSIADLIDNSITAKATQVDINFHWLGDDSFVAIADNGQGISVDDINAVMRPGSTNPLESRTPTDLGRFGLGLKTASFSQARSLTVASRTQGSTESVTRRWDLDHVGQTRQWQLLKKPRSGSEHRLRFTDDGHGTVVLWEDLDRIVSRGSQDSDKRHFFAAASRLERHLAAIFHRFIERKHLRINVNGNPVPPWNPFLPDESQWLPREELPFRGSTVRVRPYVLPHHSRFSSRKAHETAGGIKGWNAQQGFYVYRADRLILFGGWLVGGFKPEEHYKLARISLDIDQDMDAAWDIDVRKSRARPPAGLTDDLVRIARATRKRASEVYRHRGTRLSKLAPTQRQIPVWNADKRNDEFVYSINRSHALVKSALASESDRRTAVLALLDLIERTMPIDKVIFDHSTDPEAQTNPDTRTISSELIEAARLTYTTLVEAGMDEILAKQSVLELEPFYNHPEVVEALT